MGLTVRLDERAGISWRLNGEAGMPQRSAPRETQREIQVCARCHARRAQLSDEADPGRPFLDGYRPALLSAGLYHPDGQIEDEVYVWGSFLQSRMYQAGVTCSDCHDPHSGELRLPGDQVCYQCHREERYATKAHHFHAADSTGASCVACHMPASTYMQVDPRHDHSIRIPRPDLSLQIGTPNPCNGCHLDRDPQWAVRQLKTWYGRQPQGLQNYAPALHAARRQLPEARVLLQALAGDPGQPGIARATALASLGAYPGRHTLALLEQGLKARDPLQRLGTLDALESMGQRERLKAFPLLWDELRAVRIEAGRLLAPFPPGRLPEAQRAQLERAIQEYMTVQRFNADRPESHFNLGGLYADQKEYTKAEAAYLKALELQPGFVPAYVNLAQLLSGQGREGEGEAWLRRGLRQAPDNADLYHALGLSLVRQKRTEEAMQALRRAVELAPDNTRYAYVYGVALNSAGRVDDALALLGAVHERHPGNTEVLYALATINRDAHRPAAARRYARRLLEIEPDNAGFARLLSGLERPAD
jgi:predicted CXXCH cytochrome family protein